MDIYKEILSNSINDVSVDLSNKLPGYIFLYALEGCSELYTEINKVNNEDNIKENVDRIKRIHTALDKSMSKDDKNSAYTQESLVNALKELNYDDFGFAIDSIDNFVNFCKEVINHINSDDKKNIIPPESLNHIDSMMKNLTERLVQI